MALGNPLLAAYDSTGTLRTFEYAAGVFVQMGSLGGLAHVVTSDQIAHGAMTRPLIYWTEDDSNLGVWRTKTSTTFAHDYLNADTSRVVAETTYPGSAESGVFRGERIDPNLFAIMLVDPGFVAANATLYFVGGTAPAFSIDGSLDQTPLFVMAARPDRQYLVMAGGGTIKTHKRTSAANVRPATWTPVTGLAPTIDVDLAAWSFNNRSLIVVDKTQNRAQVWMLDADVWTMMHDLSLPAGTPARIASSPDGRFMAISCDNAGEFTTRVFRRTGDYFMIHQTLAGIGALLDFSADGVLLIDCAEQVCYERGSDDLFAVKNGAMANIPALVVQQAISFGRTDAYGVPRLYDAAVEDFASGAVDLENLKVTLLSSAAVFDPSDATLADATSNGSWEPAGGGWPAGGVDLGDVAGVPGDNGYDLTLGEFSRVIVDSGITFRYLLIYDATSGVPLINVDLIEDRVVAKNRELVINFRGAFLLNFRS